MYTSGGFYVMGEYTSVAWYATKEQADRVCQHLNQRGGTIYRVVPA